VTGRREPGLRAMSREATMNDDPRPPRRPPANLRTALVLLTIAAVFFAGVIAKRVFLG
jgi:hypothetical protein